MSDRPVFHWSDSNGLYRQLPGSVMHELMANSRGWAYPSPMTTYHLPPDSARLETRAGLDQLIATIRSLIKDGRLPEIDKLDGIEAAIEEWEGQ